MQADGEESRVSSDFGTDRNGTDDSAQPTAKDSKFLFLINKKTNYAKGCCTK